MNVRLAIRKTSLRLPAVKRIILISDDNPAVAKAFAQGAEELGVTILAEVPNKVVVRARKEQPDLIILDIQQADGLEVLSLLKTGLSTRKIPVVVVAAEESPTLRDMALEIGADAFVAKPLEADFLPKVITLLGPQKK